MATRLTESRLRQIIREEASRLVPRRLGEAFSYSIKVKKLNAAHAALIDVAEYEAREVGGEDPELEEIISALEGYIEAVEVMATQEPPAAGGFSDPGRRA